MTEQILELLKAELAKGSKPETVKALTVLVSELVALDNKQEQFQAQVEMAERHADCKDAAPATPGPGQYA